MRDGATAHDVHRAVSKGFTDRGYHLGHVTGHSIGMTMIEHPRVGEGMETVLRSGMVLSMHPHAIAADGKACLYMQDTWLVTDGGGEPLTAADEGFYERPMAGLDPLGRQPVLLRRERAAAGQRSQVQIVPPSSRRSKSRPQRGHSAGITRARMKSALISTTQSTA